MVHTIMISLRFPFIVCAEPFQSRNTSFSVFTKTSNCNEVYLLKHVKERKVNVSLLFMINLFVVHHRSTKEKLLKHEG